MTQRIAVYGGSFDPFHTGHLVPTVRAQETFKFDAVHFVPAGNPPHKQGEPLTPITHRLSMVALATLPYERFFASDDEVFVDGPTYTVETVRRYRERYPRALLYFLLGSDSFSQIATWERWDELVDLAHLVVLHRAHIWGPELRERVPEELRSRSGRGGALRQCSRPHRTDGLSSQPRSLPGLGDRCAQAPTAGISHPGVGPARGQLIHREVPTLPDR